MENSPFIVEFATKPVHLGGFPLPFLITKGYHDWLIVKFHPAPSRHTWGTAAGAPAANSQPCLHQSMRWKKERSLEADWKSKQSRLRLCLVCPWILQKIIRSSLVFQPSGREEGHAIERQVNWSHILAFILHIPRFVGSIIILDHSGSSQEGSLEDNNKSKTTKPILGPTSSPLILHLSVMCTAWALIPHGLWDTPLRAWRTKHVAPGAVWTAFIGAAKWCNDDASNLT